MIAQKIHVQYRSKGLQHYTRAMRVYYTHITRSVHAVPTQCPRSCHAVSTHLTRKYTKMRVITRVQFHAVRIVIACKITRSRSTGAH